VSNSPILLGHPVHGIELRHCVFQ